MKYIKSFFAEQYNDVWINYSWMCSFHRHVYEKDVAASNTDFNLSVLFCATLNASHPAGLPLCSFLPCRSSIQVPGVI